MSKYKFLLFAGLFMSVLPYLGFPSSWDTVMYTVGGFCIALISVLARIQFKNNHKEVVVEKQPAYVESIPSPTRRVRRQHPKVSKIVSQGDVAVVPMSSPANIAE